MEIKPNNIYLGDCLELMQYIDDKTVDLIVTDPPYKLIAGGRKSTLLVNNFGNDRNKSNSPFTTSGECFSNKTPAFSSWIPDCYRILKESSYAFFMCNDRNMRELWDVCESNGFIFCELLVMKKKNKVPSSYFYKNAEFILMFRKGAYRKLYKYGNATVIDVNLPRGKQKEHPTEKPVSLLLPILESCSKESDTVLDPFIGSGTTAIACINTNRSFIGIEKEPKYFEIAQKRIEQAKSEVI